jgi:sugar phosphate isomerase/epimerase
MRQLNRREALRGAAAIAGFFASAKSFAAATKIKMCLNTSNIGVNGSLTDTIAMAVKYGFDAVDPNTKDLAALSDSAMSAMLDDMAAKNVTFGSVNPGISINPSDDAFAANMKDLALTAKALQRARMTRARMPISSSDNRLTYMQNFRLHTRRLGQAATILGDCGVRIGLEYLGPKTMWSRGRYPFIHDMASMRELIAEIGKPNVGLLMDIWHWYNAGDTVADVLALKGSDVVVVHLSDAPAGVPLDQQVDSHRELPTTTGVIDTAGFMNALNKIGFDGPAADEPNNADLRKLPPEEALAKTAEAMKKAFALIQ